MPKKKKKNLYFTLCIKINISLKEWGENEAHLNNFIALEVANSSVSSFTADEKKSKYRTDVEQTAFKFCHTPAVLK